MTFLQVVILSAIEGITEFLPISSTGHLLVTEKLLGLASSDFLTSFSITVQLGAILAVVAIFGHQMLTHRDILLKSIVGFIPTAIVGFILYHFIKSFLLTHLIIVPLALIVGGIVFIWLEKFYLPKQGGELATEISYRQAFWLGLCQSLAIIPGVSRSGAVIVGGLLFKIDRPTIVNYSFWLAVPTMAAATGYILLKTASVFSFGDWQTLTLGFVLSFIVSLVVVKWLIAYVKKHNFVVFGWYRIIAGLLILAFIYTNF